MIQYSFSDLLLYFFIYSFFGWCAEVIYASIAHRKFINKGFLNLPLVCSYGLSIVILIHMIPTLHHFWLLRYVTSFAVFHVLWSLSEFFIQKICGLDEQNTSNIPTLSFRSQLLFESIASMILLICVLIVHPFIHALVRLIPIFIIHIFNLFSTVILTLDFISVLYSINFNKHSKNTIYIQQKTQNLASFLVDMIWNRLEKNYPGLQRQPSSTDRSSAHHLSFDKLVWLFFISSFLGALIEMVFCRFTAGYWMNRSSLLYGPFSIVWGIGAVVLTIALKPLHNKPVTLIFLAGFVIGGVYEYFCSIFTELLFGTVFWDYSHMILSISGRTNVLYCFFWGVLSVVWIRFIYPCLNRNIERIPAVYRKLLVWLIVFVMTLNIALTCGAMFRYRQRQTNPVSHSAVESFFDSLYDDQWMQRRWPNMKVIHRKA